MEPLLKNYFLFFSPFVLCHARACAGDQKNKFPKPTPSFALLRRKHALGRALLSLSLSLSQVERRRRKKEEKAHIHFLSLTA